MMTTKTQYKRMVEPAFRLKYTKEELEGEWKKYVFDFISKEGMLLRKHNVEEHLSRRLSVEKMEE